MKPGGFQCTCAVTLIPGQPMIVDKSNCPLHSPRAITLRDLSPMGGGPKS